MKTTTVHAGPNEYIKVKRGGGGGGGSGIFGILILGFAIYIVCLIIRFIAWIIETLGMLGGILAFAAMLGTCLAICFYAFATIRWDFKNKKWIKMLIIIISSFLLISYIFDAIRPTIVRALSEWNIRGGTWMQLTDPKKANIAFFAYFVSTPMPVYGIL